MPNSAPQPNCCTKAKAIVDQGEVAGRTGADQRDEGQRQVHRHRIVDTGLDLQRRGHPLVEHDARAGQQREHRRRIGGADDGAEQQGGTPVQADEQHAGHRGDAGADDHPQRRQQRRRPQAGAKGRIRGAQTAVEQDDGQRDVADPETEHIVVEAETDRRRPRRSARRRAGTPAGRRSRHGSRTGRSAR